MMISGPQQTELVERYADAALDHLAALLQRRRKEIRQRLMLRVTAIGLVEYGDRTWHLLDEQLESEAIDELADGGFYLVPPMARRAGDLVAVEGSDGAWYVAVGAA